MYVRRYTTVNVYNFLNLALTKINISRVTFFQSLKRPHRGNCLTHSSQVNKSPSASKKSQYTRTKLLRRRRRDFPQLASFLLLRSPSFPPPRFFPPRPPFLLHHEYTCHIDTTTIVLKLDLHYVRTLG